MAAAVDECFGAVAGALDLALALAAKEGADLLIANDPDADRLAVAVPDGEGGYVPLSGNQVGALLADELMRYGETENGLVATTIVSSTLLSKMAAAHGVAYAETLTGFKWLGNRAEAWQREGGRFVMGYEEALGYSLGEIVRDKDGVSASLVFCDLAARCKRDGVTVLHRLADLYRAHGVHVTSQKSVKFPGAEGAEKMAAIMDALRATPPTELAGRAVVRLTDIQAGTSRALPGGAEEALDLPASNVLGFYLEDASRILVRPSGTEPKIKFYFEGVEPLGDDEKVADAEARALARQAELVTQTLARAGV